MHFGKRDTLAYEDYIAPAIPESESGEHNTEMAHITFDTLKSEKQEKQAAEAARNESITAARLFCSPLELLK